MVLKDNMLESDIPVSILDTRSLLNLDLSNNRLQGELPWGSANVVFPLLCILDLGNNTLSGMLPSWLRALPQVQILDLYVNQFNGTVSRNLYLLQAYCTVPTSTNKSSLATYDGFKLIIKNGSYSFS